MERIKLVVPGDARATIVQVKNVIVKSNLLELKKLEECQRRHPAMTMEQVAKKLTRPF